MTLLLSFLVGALAEVLLLFLGAGIVWCSKNQPVAIQWVARVISIVWIAGMIVLFFKGQFVMAMGWIMTIALFLLWVVYRNKKEGK